jgi:protein-L-isoaspartate(D-aspartate) O-methyltransferase
MLGEEDVALLRERMVRSVEREAAPRDPRILEAFRAVPRHLFVPGQSQAAAYDDRALPIGEGQTISQPSMIAMMLDRLRCAPTSRVLEVGAGSGYAAALLARLAERVDAIEILPALAERARAVLDSLGVDNVVIHVGDGSRGLPERGPFDCILVSAAPARVPPALLEQLAPGGRIVIPVGDGHVQTLLVGEHQPDGSVTFQEDVPCVFVPLIET